MNNINYNEVLDLIASLEANLEDNGDESIIYINNEYCMAAGLDDGIIRRAGHYLATEGQELATDVVYDLLPFAYNGYYTRDGEDTFNFTVKPADLLQPLNEIAKYVYSRIYTPNIVM